MGSIAKLEIIDNSFFLPGGTQITCERGHDICKTSTDIKSGDTQTVNQFTDWQQGLDPKEGEIISDCPSCGSKFIKMTSGYVPALSIFANGHWNPEESDNDKS